MMNALNRILVVSQIYPYPLHDGGRMDVFYRLRALSELGYQTTLVAFYNPALSFPDVESLRQYCSHIYPVPYLRRQWSKLLHWKPYAVASRENWVSIEEIIDKINDDEYLSVIAESHHVLTVADRFRTELNIPKLYLRSHNHEPRFMRSIALSSTSLSIKHLFFNAEACKYAFYLPALMKRMKSSDAVWHISYDECREQQKKYPHLDHSFFPAGIDVSNISPFQMSSQKNVLFAGALFSPNNLQGLRWYLKYVHPKLLKKYEDYHFIIAGNTEGANRRQIARLWEHAERVEFYDTPKDMAPIYSESQVFVNPMQYGAGVKLKTLDAVVRGLPVVTTTIGNEGTGLQNDRDVLIGDTPDQFAAHLVELLTTPEKRADVVHSAQQFLVNNYCQTQSLCSYLAVKN